MNLKIILKIKYSKREQYNFKVSISKKIVETLLCCSVQVTLDNR